MLSTGRKIALARVMASALFALGLKPNRIVRRRGVTFELDLTEGIDFSIFLLGGFQADVLRLIERFVPDDGMVIDVGANLGAIALPVAAAGPRRRVLAIEPTDYAFRKLERNLENNPALRPRVTLLKSFIADETRTTSDLVAYSRWPLSDQQRRGNIHPVHLGLATDAFCGQTTLDDVVAHEPWSSVALIKIDTDGHEFRVLRGAGRCLSTIRPLVLFEACQYLMEPPAATFEDFEKLFHSHSYTICRPHSLQAIDGQTFRRKCPVRGGLDLLAVPNERLNAMLESALAKSPAPARSHQKEIES